jgi:hypothetical protein
VNSLSSSVNSLEWRRNKVLELSSQGHSQPEIAKILQISQSTVHRDLVYLRKQAQKNLQKHIQDRLPEEYQCCLTGMNQVLRLSWEIANRSKNSNNDDNGQTVTTMTDDKTRLQALSLINDCYKYIMDLTTNGVVVTDAIKFVQNSKEKLNTSKELENGKHSELEEEQEEETVEITTNTTTTNQVF